MDQTFFVFLILFGVLIIYLFKQKSEQETNQNMKQELKQFIEQENFENLDETTDSINDINEINLTTQSDEYTEPSLVPEPSNKPNAPVPNGFSTTLNFNHPDKINGCDIVNIAPMNYYEEMNKKINITNGEKVMNGGNFGEVMGVQDDEELYFVDN